MAGYCCNGTNMWTSEEELSGKPWYSGWVVMWTSWFRKDGSISGNGDSSTAADNNRGTNDDGDKDNG